MNNRNLGRSGIEVSEISFGTVSLGRPYGIGINGPQDIPAESEAIDLLRSAFDHDINFYDTARFYGQSAVLVGIDKIDYLQAALKVADGNYLDESTPTRAKQLAYPDPDFLDLQKWDVMGWLK